MKGYHVAVVSPLSPFGQRVRRLIDEGDFPAIELKLFNPTLESSSTLTQFQGEVLATQPVDADLLPAVDVMFVGEGTGEDVLALVASVAREGVLTFVADKAAGLSVPVAAHGLNDKFLPADARMVGVPSTASILVGKVLNSIAGSFDIEQAFATAMLPVSELGERAAEELHQQVVQILNFGDPSTEFLGEQLAFNLVPSSDGSGEEPPEDLVAREAAELSGLEGGVLSVTLVRVPVFHSYAVSLWVQLASDATPEGVIAAMGEREGIEVGEALEHSAAIATPVSVAGSDKVHVGNLRPDRARAGAFRLWVVADSVAVDAAANSLALAKKLLQTGGVEADEASEADEK